MTPLLALPVLPCTLLLFLLYALLPLPTLRTCFSRLLAALKCWRNVPRSYFLPPRADAVPVFPTRTAVLLTGSVHAGLALAGAWVYLGTHGRFALALAVVPVPACVGVFAAYAFVPQRAVADAKCRPVSLHHKGGSIGSGDTETLCDVGPPIQTTKPASPSPPPPCATRPFMSRALAALAAGGGITPNTVLPRILPLAFVPTVLALVLVAITPAHAGLVLLGLTAAMAAAALGLGVAAFRRPKSWAPLASRPATAQGEYAVSQHASTHPRAVQAEHLSRVDERELEAFVNQDVDDWVTTRSSLPAMPDFTLSFNDTMPLSLDAAAADIVAAAREYQPNIAQVANMANVANSTNASNVNPNHTNSHAPTVATAGSTRNPDLATPPRPRPGSAMHTTGSPSSWLSSPGSCGAEWEWDFTRSPDSSRQLEDGEAGDGGDASEYAHANSVSHAMVANAAGQANCTFPSAMASFHGDPSLVAAYEADAFSAPPPRGFASLVGYRCSPSDGDVVNGERGGHEHIHNWRGGMPPISAYDEGHFVNVDLAADHSHSIDFTRPSTEYVHPTHTNPRRFQPTRPAPPRPSTTPSGASQRTTPSPSATVAPSAIGELDRGAGLVAMLALTLVVGLNTPVLVLGSTAAALGLFAAAACVPAPLLWVGALRLPRVAKDVERGEGVTSTQVEAHNPEENKPTTSAEITTHAAQAHTPGNTAHAQRPVPAIDRLNRMEDWLAAGHARDLGTIGRALEMVKPSPALCVLDGPASRPRPRHRDLGRRESLVERVRRSIGCEEVLEPTEEIAAQPDQPQVEIEMSNGPASTARVPTPTARAPTPTSRVPAIHITETRRSVVSTSTDDTCNLTAQIQVARTARRSPSPSFVMGDLAAGISGLVAAREREAASAGDSAGGNGGSGVHDIDKPAACTTLSAEAADDFKASPEFINPKLPSPARSSSPPSPAFDPSTALPSPSAPASRAPVSRAPSREVDQYSTPARTAAAETEASIARSAAAAAAFLSRGRRGHKRRGSGSGGSKGSWFRMFAGIDSASLASFRRNATAAESFVHGAYVESVESDDVELSVKHDPDAAPAGPATPVTSTLQRPPPASVPNLGQSSKRPHEHARALHTEFAHRTQRHPASTYYHTKHGNPSNLRYQSGSTESLPLPKGSLGSLASVPKGSLGSLASRHAHKLRPSHKVMGSADSFSLPSDEEVVDGREEQLGVGYSLAPSGHTRPNQDSTSGRNSRANYYDSADHARGYNHVSAFSGYSADTSDPLAPSALLRAMGDPPRAQLMRHPHPPPLDFSLPGTHDSLPPSLVAAVHPEMHDLVFPASSASLATTSTAVSDAPSPAPATSRKKSPTKQSKSSLRELHLVETARKRGSIRIDPPRHRDQPSGDALSVDVVRAGVSLPSNSTSDIISIGGSHPASNSGTGKRTKTKLKDRLGSRGPLSDSSANINNTTTTTGSRGTLPKTSKASTTSHSTSNLSSHPRPPPHSHARSTQRPPRGILKPPRNKENSNSYESANAGGHVRAGRGRNNGIFAQSPVRL